MIQGWMISFETHSHQHDHAGRYSDFWLRIGPISPWTQLHWLPGVDYTIVSSKKSCGSLFSTVCIGFFFQYLNATRHKKKWTSRVSLLLWVCFVLQKARAGPADDYVSSLLMLVVRLCLPVYNREGYKPTQILIGWIALSYWNATFPPWKRKTWLQGNES